jgi:site-specific DNA-methyltransferase (adenine-specific)
MTMPRRPRGGTRTSAFGSPGRVSHDSSAYYGRRLYEGLPREASISWSPRRPTTWGGPRTNTGRS